MAIDGDTRKIFPAKLGDEHKPNLSEKTSENGILKASR